MNRRVAAHMTHKTHAASESATPAESRAAADSRAAQAAARVAARYASAPSYSEMLADEARAALRAAEAATRAAQKAHAAAQFVLAGLEAASSAEAEWDQQFAGERPADNAIDASGNSAGPMLVEEESQGMDRQEAERTAPVSNPARGRGKSRKQRSAAAEMRTDDPPEPALPMPAILSADEAPDGGVVEPIYANLIQFPREVVATRKVRPRRAEGPLATTAAEAQLSIFEVDPGAISTQPASAAVDEPAAPAWMRPEWTSIRLEEQPQAELPEEPAPQVRTRAAAEMAPLSLRLLAFVVDGSLIVAAFLAAARLALGHANALPGPRAVELGTAFALLLIAAAYQTLFFTLASATPGMKYAGIGLVSFDGASPSREQRIRRLKAMLLSILPLCLGLVWSVFDDGHFTWHDRLSRTYLRKY